MEYPHTLRALSEITQLTDTDLEKIIKMMKQSTSASDFSDRFTRFILASESLQGEIAEKIISQMLLALNQDLEIQKQAIIDAPPNESELKDFGEMFLFKNEKLEFNTELIDTKFLAFTASLGKRIQGMDDNEILQDFLQSENISTDHPFALRVQNYLNTKKEQIQVQQ